MTKPDETLSLSGLLKDHEEVAALRAEIERLRGEVTRLDALIDRGLYAEVERLKTALQAVLDDQEGDLDFVKWQVRQVLGNDKAN